MKNAKRVEYKKEPELHVHRYILAIGRRVQPKRGKAYWHTQYRYALNLAEVREQRDRAPVGAIVEVYEAVHNFREAWEING